MDQISTNCKTHIQFYIILTSNQPKCVHTRWAQFSLPLGLVNVGVFHFGSFITTGAIVSYCKFDANTFYLLFGASHASAMTTSSDELYVKSYAGLNVSIFTGHYFKPYYYHLSLLN